MRIQLNMTIEIIKSTLAHNGVAFVRATTFHLISQCGHDTITRVKKVSQRSNENRGFSSVSSHREY